VMYTAPVSVDEVCQALTDNATANVFAGATDLIPQSQAGRPFGDVLVDLKRIPRLVGLSAEDSGWTIGAAISAARMADHSELRSDYPGLVEAVALIGSDQIQNRASIGGNICNASPAADSGPSLVVNEARAVIASASGIRTTSIPDLVAGPGMTSLASGEFVVEFLLDRPQPGTADAYLRFTPRTEMDIAVVGAAARVTVDASGLCSGAAVALGAVAPTVVVVDAISDALMGSPFDGAALNRCAELSKDACRPIDDKRGTKEFRRHLAGVLTTRVLRIAAERARMRT
jgi:CO/xanthine dehydrogenase FAD-binding subunit